MRHNLYDRNKRSDLEYLSDEDFAKIITGEMDAKREFGKHIFMAISSVASIIFSITALVIVSVC